MSSVWHEPVSSRRYRGIASVFTRLTGPPEALNTRNVGIEVLGPLTIDGDALDLSRRDRVVVGALAACRGEPVSMDQFADALWGDGPPASWRKLVQGCVMRLRKLLGPTRSRPPVVGTGSSSPARMSTRSGSTGCWRGRAICSPGASPNTPGTSQRRRSPLARAGTRRRPRVGPRPDRGRASRRTAPRRPGGSGRSRGSVRSAGDGPRRPQALVRAQPLRETAGPARPRPVPVGPAIGRLATLRQVRGVLAEEPVWIPVRTWSPWSRRSWRRTRRWSGARRSPSRRPPAPISGCCPTRSTTPTGSSGGRSSWTNACGGSARTGR